MILSLVFGLAALAASPAPPPQTPLGPCKLDRTVLVFAGSDAVQAACLLRRVRPKGGGADAQVVPPTLLARLGRPVEVLPARLDAYLARRGVARGDVGATGIAGDVPARRYFVIHDTSSPEIAVASGFPANVNDAAYGGNRLTGWASVAEKVNAITSRDGRSRMFQDWKAARPSPATRIEQTNILARARPVFVHVENIQPRLKPVTGWAWQAPDPGFGPAQLDRLALLYVVASVRAGRWLTPAFHFNIDQDNPTGDWHDDPQGFDLARWAAAIDRVTADIAKS